jgi:hypothetical protein
MISGIMRVRMLLRARLHFALSILFVLAAACGDGGAGGLAKSAAAATDCEGGYCDVEFKRSSPTPDLKPKPAASIEMTNKLVPSGAKSVGLFSAPNPGDNEDCNDDVLAMFRKKAGALGFDGVAEIHRAVRVPEDKKEKRSVTCYGTPFVR